MSNEVIGKSGISCKVLLGTSSIYTCYPPIWTLQLKFPRFILAQFSKHRMFSFNSVSSRAVGTTKMIEKMEANPMQPLAWGAKQKGMSGKGTHDALLTGVYDKNNYYCEFKGSGDNGITKEEAWRDCQVHAYAYADAYERAGYHGEVPNRLLEPFQHIEIIVTATDFDNFFSLRFAEDAQSEIQELARVMKTAMDSYALQRPRASYHLPMVDDEELQEFGMEQSLKLSAARCCVISYYNHKGAPMGMEGANKLYNHLVNNGGQEHYTPLEHQASMPSLDQHSIIVRAQEFMLSQVCNSLPSEFVYNVKRKVKQLEYFANFHGWVSHRYSLGG